MDLSRRLAAEAIGTFMLVASVLGAALFATAAPSVALGVALSIGLTVMALAYALGPVSGAHFNPAVTLGLVAAGRFETSDAVGYIVAQCFGGILAAAVFFFLIGTGAEANLARVSNGWGTLSAANAGIVSVFVTEVVMTAFFLLVIVGVSARPATAGFVPLAVGLALTAIHLMAIPISNASVNPARSLATALFGGPTALGQVWLFWVAPIIGGVLGGAIGKWLLSIEPSVRSSTQAVNIPSA
jgi:aquaporin Z